MKTPWVPFDYYLCGGIGGQFAFVAEPNWLATGSQTNPIGTGPFVFQEWVPNDHFTATKNPNYWRTGMPYLDSITYKPIPDPDQLLASLKSGVVDIMHTDTGRRHHALRGDTVARPTSTTRRTWPASRTWAACSSTCPRRRSTTSSCARPWPTPSAPAQYVEVIDDGVNRARPTAPFTSASPYYLADNGYPDVQPGQGQPAGHRGEAARPGSR